MKKSILALAILLATATGAQAAESAGAKTAQAAPKTTTASSKGIVKSLDASLGIVTLSHEPVPALQWSAMTMPFRISPALAKGLKVDQKVEFEFEAQGMSATITRITVAK